MKHLPRTDRSILSNWWWAIDRLTLFALAVLIVCGIMLVSSASPPAAEHYGLSPFYYVHRQLIFLIPTIAFIFLVSLMNEKTLWRISLVAMPITITMMIAAIFFGPEVNGAHRWITLHGISIQPSEFAKPFFAIISAWLIAKARQKPGFPGYQLSLGLFLVIISLMLMEPDLGMSFVLACMWGVQMFLSGLPIIVIVGLVGIGIIGLFCAYLFSPHVTSRIDRFLDPAVGNNYQVKKSLLAFSHGGFWGTGPDHGIIKLTLPDAHEDFIFAVAAEEFGMITAVLLILVYAFVIVRSVSRIYRNEDMFVILATTALLVQFGLQSLIHMGSSLQLLPAKGMTLPFISYGGSSLLSFGLAFGALLVLTRKRKTGLLHDNI